MTKSLIEAKKWALDVKSCLCEIETWLHHRENNIEKVTLGYVENLLSFNPLPCNEPGHLKLKVNKLQVTLNFMLILQIHASAIL